MYLKKYLTINEKNQNIIIFIFSIWNTPSAEPIKSNLRKKSFSFSGRAFCGPNYLLFLFFYLLI